MSKQQKRGKLRNPPKGRQYAFVAVVIVLLVVAGSSVYLYATRTSTTSTTSSISSSSSSSSSAGVSSSTTSSSSSSTTSTTSTSSTTAASTFANTPCAASSTTATTSGSSSTYAVICTNLGAIEIELYPQYAPKTVANFVSLSQSGFYDDLVWHRIDPGFVIQTGDPTTKNGGGNRDDWGQGTSGTYVPFESSSLQNVVGSVAMASTGAKVGGSSQFYINLANNTSLDGSYAVFGQVISGMSVANAIAKVPIITDTSSPEYDQPVAPSTAYIISVTIQSSP